MDNRKQYKLRQGELRRLIASPGIQCSGVFLRLFFFSNGIVNEYIYNTNSRRVIAHITPEGLTVQTRSRYNPTLERLIVRETTKYGGIQSSHLANVARKLTKGDINV